MSPDEPRGKKVDEDWKRRAQEEKERLQQGPAGPPRKIEVPSGVRPDPAPAAPPRPEPAARPAEPKPDEEARRVYPQATFDTFVAGLAAQAIVSLGQIEHPETRERYLDLDQARYTIDTLVMLREKTRGNLSAAESGRIDAILSELQMLYVHVAKSVPST